MPGEQRGIEPDALGVGLYNVGNRLGGQALAHGAAFLDRAKDSAVADAGGREPCLFG